MKSLAARDLRRLSRRLEIDLRDDFVEWFCRRNYKPVMKLSEVVEQFELWKREKEQQARYVANE